MRVKLPRTGEGRWRLPQHAHVIVYETMDGNELFTIYDCGAAQKPPSAQVAGNIVRVKAAHVLERSPTGYIVKMREKAELVAQDDGHYLIESGDSAQR